jgi:predicted MFS family arabinose efflux permease
MTIMTALRPLTVICTFTFGAMLCMGSLPFMVGGFVEQLGFSLATAGRIASVEATSMAVACAVTAWIARRQINLRVIVIVGTALLGISNLACTWAGQPEFFGIARGASGFATGLIYSAGNLYIARIEKPDRLFAVYYGVGVFAAAVGLLLAPELVGRLGIHAAYASFGCAAMLALLAVPFYPQKSASLSTQPGIDVAVATHASRAGGLLILFALLVNYAFNGGIWIYFERIGFALHMEPDQLGLVLSVGTLLGLLGSLASVALGTRLGRFFPIAIGHVLSMVSVGLLQGASIGGFYAAAALLNVAITLLTPYCLGALALTDRDGRMALLGTFALLAGYGLGPALISTLLRGQDFQSALFWTQAAFVLTLLMFSLAFYLLRTPRPVGRPVGHKA